MRVLLGSIAALVLGATWSWAQDDEPGTPPAGASRWFVAAGITSYRDQDIPGRTEADAYAYLLGQILANPDMGEVPLEHAGIYCGSAATTLTIRQALQAAATGSADDVLFVYLCLTPALLPQEDGSAKLVLCTYGTKLSELATTSLHFDEFVELVAAVPATTKVVFLDFSPWSAVRPQGADEGLAPPGDYLERLAAVAAVVSAVSPSEPTVEDDLARPLLGFCLTTAAQANADGIGDGNRPDGRVTLPELWEHTRQTAGRVYEGRAGQTPRALGTRVPPVLFCKVVRPDRRCPADMRLVEDRVCVDVYEAPNVAGAMPMTGPNLFGFQGYCKGRGKRICEPDEWEAACKGPDGTRFPYGNNPIMGVCNIGAPDVEAARAERIGSRPYCVNGYGLYDMVGNVSEYIGSWGGGTGTADVRGGSFRDQDVATWDCRRAGVRQPVQQGPFIGTRCCRDPG